MTYSNMRREQGHSAYKKWNAVHWPSACPSKFLVNTTPLGSALGKGTQWLTINEAPTTVNDAAQATRKARINHCEAHSDASQQVAVATSVATSRQEKPGAAQV